MSDGTKWALRPGTVIPMPFPTPLPQDSPVISLESIEDQISALGTQLVQLAQFQGGTNDTFVHDQATPATIWDFANPFLTKCPSVSIVDTAGTEVIGGVEYVGYTRIILTFAYAFSGKAFLN